MEAKFICGEIVLSAAENESKDLNDYLEVVAIDKKDIEYKFSNPELFEINGSEIIAKNTGSSFVYATYQSNSLDSMKIVVSKPFSQPKNFVLDESGLLTWDPVYEFYANDTAPTFASGYWIEGTRTVYSLENPDQVEKVENILEKKARMEYNIRKYRPHERREVL